MTVLNATKMITTFQTALKIFFDFIWDYFGVIYNIIFIVYFWL